MPYGLEEQTCSSPHRLIIRACLTAWIPITNNNNNISVWFWLFQWVLLTHFAFTSYIFWRFSFWVCGFFYSNLNCDSPEIFILLFPAVTILLSSCFCSPPSFIILLLLIYPYVYCFLGFCWYHHRCLFPHCHHFHPNFFLFLDIIHWCWYLSLNSRICLTWWNIYPHCCWLVYIFRCLLIIKPYVMIFLPIVISFVWVCCPFCLPICVLPCEWKDLYNEFFLFPNLAFPCFHICPRCYFFLCY